LVIPNDVALELEKLKECNKYEEFVTLYIRSVKKGNELIQNSLISTDVD
jgi:hypothetical protein